jgi:hypothetical protein
MHTAGNHKEPKKEKSHNANDENHANMQFPLKNKEGTYLHSSPDFVAIIGTLVWQKGNNQIMFVSSIRYYQGTNSSA